MKKLFNSYYLSNTIFYILTGLIGLFVLANFIEILFPITQLLLVALVAFVLIDSLLLYIPKRGIKLKRILPEKFSNGDHNEVGFVIKNNYAFNIYCEIIDELPNQFQLRDFSIIKKVKAQDQLDFKYDMRPTTRGEYHFGQTHVLVNSPLKLISRKYSLGNAEMVKTYPSFIQLRKFDLLAFSNNLSDLGLKKIRRIGHTLEFEQIKEYNQGDDLRTINWKATAKKNQLMVNQYQDEKSQPVYNVIDKGRVMKMPFKEMSLLDYAINSTLVISNVILKKQDKAGIFTFSKKVENLVVAERRTSQMNLILETLYNTKTDFFESDYSRLYADIKRTITHRSLIMLYTNFETLDGLNRQLPYLRAIAKHHLLVVIFFKNTELKKIITDNADTIQKVYDKVVAEKFTYEKKLIVNELKKYGIHSILTAPEDLSVNTINKYIELKARGLH